MRRGRIVGLVRRLGKAVYLQGYRGFKSLPLRQKQLKIMNDQIEKLEKEIAEIRERNKRVEQDKAWETSLFRKILITIGTYVITALVFHIINVKYFYLNAFIPTIGYFLSVQTLPSIKRWWIGRH